MKKLLLVLSVVFVGRAWALSPAQNMPIEELGEQSQIVVNKSFAIPKQQDHVTFSNGSIQASEPANSPFCTFYLKSAPSTSYSVSASTQIRVSAVDPGYPDQNGNSYYAVLYLNNEQVPDYDQVVCNNLPKDAKISDLNNILGESMDIQPVSGP